jgi:hypothetical protein
MAADFAQQEPAELNGGKNFFSTAEFTTSNSEELRIGRSWAGWGCHERCTDSATGSTHLSGGRPQLAQEVDGGFTLAVTDVSGLLIGDSREWQRRRSPDEP